MTYYDERKNVEEYIEMAEGYDDSELIAILKEHLPLQSTVLELGMGPGTDLDLLAQSYKVTGSDFSSVFLDVYREKHPSTELLELDAVTLKTENTFDCIYSNKVLHHLSRSDLQISFSRQKELLTQNGLLLHSFWFGEKEEEMGGLLHMYYTEADILNIVGPGFDVVALEKYKEFEEGDSFYILLCLQDK